MIDCTDVHKSYELGERRVEALRGATLRIEEPGFYAIMGPSGSGKSTLLHLLAGLDAPDSGEIRVAGRRIDALDDAAMTLYRRRDIGVVFQQFNLIPTMTARQNVELPGLLAGEDPRRLGERSRELLDALGVNGRAANRPDALSGGEQQRVAIARALFYSPKALFADEPTGNLDSRSSQALWALLREIAEKQEMTVLMVTHEPEAALHTRRVWVLRDGVVVGDFETEGVDARGLADRYRQLGG